MMEGRFVEAPFPSEAKRELTLSERLTFLESALADMRAELSTLEARLVALEQRIG